MIFSARLFPSLLSSSLLLRSILFFPFCYFALFHSIPLHPIALSVPFYSVLSEHTADRSALLSQELPAGLREDSQGLALSVSRRSSNLEAEHRFQSRLAIYIYIYMYMYIHICIERHVFHLMLDIGIMRHNTSGSRLVVYRP